MSTNGIVIVDRHEPHDQVATRLLELADEKGYESRVVVAQRGEHNAALSFSVPKDVAEAFDAEREDRWPSKIENDDEKDADRPVAALNEDAVGADNKRAATDAAVTNAAEESADDDDSNAAPRRTQRPGKANQEKPKE